MLADKPDEREGHYARFTACPTNQLLATLGQKWAAVILHCLAGGRRRYSELRRAIPSATQKMLTQTLRQLEGKGLIIRHVSGEKPPVTSEYELSPSGESLVSLLDTVTAWAEAYSNKNDG